MQNPLPRRRFLQAAAASMGSATVLAGEVRSNDAAPLTPVTDRPGPSLVFDFPALRIGVAEYAQGPTGCTVLYCPRGASAAVDIRGGVPGTLWTDQLREGDGLVHAVTFSGGSLYGLEAATGVSAELFAQRNYATGWSDIALVHASLSRAIEPFNTPVAGDVLYALSTQEVDGGDTNEFVLAAASELAWDAVLASCS